MTIDPRYFVYDLLNRSGSPMWDGTQVLLPPSFALGNRISNTNPNYAPPNIGFPSQNVASSMDVSISLTKVWGRHTIKTGFYNQYSNKQQVQGGAAGGPSLNFQQDTVGTNPCDTSFGFANAAIGCFSSYSQGSKGVEGQYIYYNTEGYVQDNWRVNTRLTLDYGLRFVHQTPQYDALGQASNFFTDQWNRAAAPVLYVAGCANGVYPCTGTNRQAMNPLTNQFLGPNTTLAIGTIVPNSGNITNGLVQADQGIPLSTYLQPALGVAPRFGAAYDLTGRQQFMLRGGGGLYFDRPSGNAVFAQVLNPPARKTRHAPLRPAADARHRRPRHRSAIVAVGLRVRQPAALVVAVERRHADGAALGHRGRRLLCRSARLQHRRGDQPQRGRLRHRVPRREPGSDAGADDAGGDVAVHRSDAGVPRVQRNHPERQPRMGHASFAAAVLQPPVP